MISSVDQFRWIDKAEFRRPLPLPQAFANLISLMQLEADKGFL